MAEAVQDPYHDLTLIGPTVEADGVVEAAQKALNQSPHRPEELVDEEVMVFEISDEPASVVNVAEVSDA